jgi:PAS domain S-box-containing protein
VSGTISEEEAVECIKRGAADYLLKDRLGRLGQAIQRALAERRLRVEQRQTEESLAYERDLFQALMDTMPDAIYFKDRESRYIRVNQAHARLLGLQDPDQAEGKTDFHFFPEQPARELYAAERRIIGTGRPDVNVVEELADPRHGTRWILTTKVPIARAGQITGLVGISRDITDLMRVEGALRRQLDFTNAIMHSLGEGVQALDVEGRLTFMNPAAEQMLGWSAADLLGQDMHDAIHFQRADGTRVSKDQSPLNDVLRSRMTYRTEDDVFTRKDGTIFPVSYTSSPIITDEGVTGAVLAFSDATARRRAEQAIRFQAHLLNTVGEAVTAADPQGTITYWNRAAEALYGWTAEEAVGRLVDEVLPAPEAQDAAAAILQSGRSWTGELLDRRRDGSTFPARVTVAPVFDERGRIMGGVGVSADITAKKEAEQQIRRQMERLSALRAIDLAIIASLDLRVTLGLLLEQVQSRLPVDAAAVLLLDPQLLMLEYAEGRGFRGTAIARSRLRLGEGLAGRAALERRLVYVPDMAASEEVFVRLEVQREERFAAYLAMPLLARGQIQGVLELYHRSPLTEEDEWLDFAASLAGQAAIAVDNARLFQNLQSANNELALAYDSTIEGWSRALDLRDKETEGHSRRVTDMTLRLARKMGLSDAELVHVRRGALLHDIGKVGIPDAILLKPGPLSDAEWQIMRRHPLYAYELLAPIAYLRPALHIPHCHHEKWDGSGYPQGLLGDKIPLEARIFAVADVYDALGSDRPYRSAWPEAKVRAHIADLAGKHFDPAIVDGFLEMEIPR